MITTITRSIDLWTPYHISVSPILVYFIIIFIKWISNLLYFLLTALQKKNAVNKKKKGTSNKKKFDINLSSSSPFLYRPWEGGADGSTETR